MNKKEVAELKRLFHPDRTPITRVCGCYVDAEKNKKTKLKEAFLSLPEEEMFKYFDIFKKTLSGSIGRNLLDMEFPLEQEAGGGAQEYLMKLRASQLKDDDLLDAFYDKVIETFLYPENYYIVLIHCAYDIPKRGTDGIEQIDASEYVYEFLLCSICPVQLSKPGLCYHEDTNTISERIRDWFVEPPVTGFLFPAFTDRNTDIHSLLYYSKNPDELNAGFARELLGCELPLSAGSQKDTFNALVADTLNDSCTYETVKNIHASLNELLEEHKDDPNPVLLDKGDVRRLLSQSGADDETLEHFDEEFEQASGSTQTELYVTNVANTRKFEIKTPNIVISVKPECADLIETQMIDGRLCFVIPMDDSVEVNGIPVKTGNSAYKEA
ncbi:MAG: DUF4317 domain-containing protein [Lachnospiraceae bacterium]|nr:DUF4317 domain-containing protein [Lachnospiraceae bacterium]MCD7834202.1 DUF4317 domain-containing protein [Lachnospiraceae bacterium]